MAFNFFVKDYLEPGKYPDAMGVSTTFSEVLEHSDPHCISDLPKELIFSQYSAAADVREGERFEIIGSAGNYDLAEDIRKCFPLLEAWEKEICVFEKKYFREEEFRSEVLEAIGEVRPEIHKPHTSLNLLWPSVCSYSYAKETWGIFLSEIEKSIVKFKGQWLGEFSQLRIGGINRDRITIKYDLTGVY